MMNVIGTVPAGPINATWPHPVPGHPKNFTYSAFLPGQVVPGGALRVTPYLPKNCPIALAINKDQLNGGGPSLKLYVDGTLRGTVDKSALTCLPNEGKTFAVEATGHTLGPKRMPFNCMIPLTPPATGSTWWYYALSGQIAGSHPGMLNGKHVQLCNVTGTSNPPDPTLEWFVYFDVQGFQANAGPPHIPASVGYSKYGEFNVFAPNSSALVPVDPILYNKKTPFPVPGATVPLQFNIKTRGGDSSMPVDVPTPIAPAWIDSVFPRIAWKGQSITVRGRFIKGHKKYSFGIHKNHSSETIGELLGATVTVKSETELIIGPLTDKMPKDPVTKSTKNNMTFSNSYPFWHWQVWVYDHEFLPKQYPNGYLIPYHANISGDFYTCEKPPTTIGHLWTAFVVYGLFIIGAAVAVVVHCMAKSKEV
eukprot:TRINITY_DN68046_c7_g2_i1.p1 TRINITY_DN68046_c7_g2~~TRINITY_DN68046_c7_g2_i1.p1  ORF type:complete len:479 (-),score=35.45 TRINITY_DN68046_c7_g2_i1:866-2128(-)